MNKKGFTLVELLVVISIVAFATTTTVVLFQDARKKQRDTRRLADINQIQRALEMYQSDKGTYPQISAAYTTAAQCGAGNRWCTLETALAPYLKPLPRDPLGLQSNFIYYYDANSGDNYKSYGLMAKMESTSNYNMVTSDGGYYQNVSGGWAGLGYEVGPQVEYCMKAYAGSNRQWWATGSAPTATVCVGGD